MAIVKRRRVGNRNRSLVPTLRNDFFSNSFLSPDLFDIDSFFDGGLSLRIPPANISETSNEFRINLSAPGLKRDDFKVEVENGDLVISSEKEEENKEEDEDYWRREFSYTGFTRRFPLPDNASEDKINARYDDGILHVTIPKKEVTAAKPRKAIQVA